GDAGDAVAASDGVTGDGGEPEEGAPDGPPAPDPPPTLSATGLYSDIGSFTIAPGIREFAPTYTLWSDGAEKRRWVYLPPGQKIDDSDMDHWSFPMGTKLWKEFRFSGNRVETRLIYKWGPNPNDFLFAAYVW